MSSETRTTALALANDYAGTHANNTPDQVIERAGKYEEFLLGAAEAAAANAAEVDETGESSEVTGSFTCDYRGEDGFLEFAGPDSEGQLEIVVERHGSSAYVYLGAWKARRLASLLLAGADAIEAGRG